MAHDHVDGLRLDSSGDVKLPAKKPLGVESEGLGTPLAELPSIHRGSLLP